MRIVRCKNSLTAVLADGRIIQTNDCTDEIFEQVKKLKEEENEFELINLLIPEIDEKDENNEEAALKKYRTFFIKVADKAETSKILEVRVDENNNQAMYWPSVSPLSLPPELADRILEAERLDDQNLLDTYKNFWTLTSLNPRPEVRRNLFRFLSKWGMVISKSGLFIGYRNVDIKQAGETPETTIYTDHHSGKTIIRIGHVTSIAIDECDLNNDRECSRGLHIGGTSWLRYNYFGSTGLVCLVNPMDVVAVPWANAEYGKIRTCAYMPIATAQYNDDGYIIPYTDKDGFDSKYVKTILYDGVMNPEEHPEYSVQIQPNKEEGQTYKTVSDKLLEVARKFIKENE
jgi:hypothetical protein